MNFWRRLRKRPTTPAVEVHDLGPDPLDPHGDGTIREGDPLWALMGSHGPVMFDRRDDGQWDVRRFEDPS